MTNRGLLFFTRSVHSELWYLWMYATFSLCVNQRPETMLRPTAIYKSQKRDNKGVA